MTSLARTPAQIGALIRGARNSAGQTQSDLAARSGVRQELISRIETGHPGVRLATIFGLLAALDLEMDIRPRSKSSAADFADLF